MLDFRDDVESDFSVLHRVDDFANLPARRFFALADRLAAYPGAVSAALAASSAPPPALEAAPPLDMSDPYPVHDNGDTPPDVIAQRRLGLLSELHGGRPMEWVDHDTLVREAQK